MIIAGIFAALVIAGLLYQAAGAARDARLYPLPGRLVDVGGHKLHVRVSGAGSPAIVLEAGIAGSSVSWEYVRAEAARFSTVCEYDRAGLGWSDPCRDARTLEGVLADLRGVIAATGLTKPVILVGHSFGGLVVLEYACRFREDVRGLVLIDPLPAAEWCPAPPGEVAKLRRGVMLSRRGALLARLGFVRLSLDLLRAGSRTIPQLAARVSSGRGSEVTERLVGQVRKLPPELWPVIQAHWCQPKNFLSMARHLESLPASAAACSTDCSLGDLPLILISAMDSTPERAEEHARMAARSARGSVVVAHKSGHWIQFDEPELIVAAIREIALLHH